MTTVNGKVEAVSKAGTGIKVGDKWYNSKSPIFDRSMYKSDIEFQVNDQGTVVGELKVSKPQYSGNKFGGAKKPYVDNSIGQGIGMSVNNACSFAINEGRGYDEQYIRSLAIKIYELAEVLKKEAAAGSFESAPKPAPVAESEDNPFV